MAGGVVLILGSGPAALKAATWPRNAFDTILAINNAWRVRPDWDLHIHPEDFPPEHRPQVRQPGQRVITAEEYVPVQNNLGGFVYAGGTMAFTAGYWALGALHPRVMAFFGCDMVYPDAGKTHFYGQGEPDPLRRDISLRSLEAKSARLQLLAASLGCTCVNLSDAETRLTFPRASLAELPSISAPETPPLSAPLAREAELGYFVPSGRYWKEESRFDPAEIDALDRLWLDALEGIRP
ncbi:hypothetical protein [Pararhodobacter sp. CCB-MM2]|uniref:hypothetical protein n=1 Tax=Pararhodobacter sp. CCB-MM2 TaxID=1786003 RepID=UPI00082A1C6A|nr:hypothetical protein [Pararhodobacter sp. CCB-MM2]